MIAEVSAALEVIDAIPDMARIEALCDEAYTLIESALKETDQTKRNAIVEKCCQISKEAGEVDGYKSVHYMAQNGAYLRIWNDRKITHSGAKGEELQTLMLRRDLANVAALGEAARDFGRIYAESTVRTLEKAGEYDQRRMQAG